MSLILNASNATQLLNLLSKLPAHIIDEINEFNSEHRTKMTPIFTSLLRHVFCPSYFHAAAEEDTQSERENLHIMNEEIRQICECWRCGNYKGSHIILKQTKIGFWLQDGNANPSIEVNYCARCFKIQKRRFEELLEQFADDDDDTSEEADIDNSDDNDSVFHELFYDLDDDNDF